MPRHSRTRGSVLALSQRSCPRRRLTSEEISCRDAPALMPRKRNVLVSWRLDVPAGGSIGANQALQARAAATIMRISRGMG